MRESDAMEQKFAWEWAFPVGAVILLAAILYGLWQYRRRSRAATHTGEQVVRQRYEEQGKWDEKL